MNKKDWKVDYHSLNYHHTSIVLDFLKWNYIGCYLWIHKILKSVRKFTFQVRNVIK